MADVQPFRAWRYDPARAGMLGDLAAPPYDVIDAAQQSELYQKNDYNVIRLILGAERPGDDDRNNRYTRAAGFLRDWKREEIVVQDRLPGMYVYHQDFEVEGERFTRRGFLARIRLEKYGEGNVFPHEETMPGPKADRLRLMHATGMNLCPLFGLFPDERHEVQQMLDAAVGQSLPLQATDALGVTSRLWTVTDPDVINQVIEQMQSRPIFIADGHHRYETALKYRDEKHQAGEVTDDSHPANFVLMMLVGMSDPGLLILPTHRLLSEVGELSAEELRQVLQSCFDCQIVGRGEEAARAAWQRIESEGGQDLLAFGTAADGVWLTARLTDRRQMEALAAGHSPAWRSLGVSVLQELVLKKLLPENLNSRPQCRYVHLLGEATEAVAEKSCDMAVLVAPAAMEHVEQIAGNLEKMPPKSTYFYPKLLSGLVFHSVEKD